MKRLEPSTLLPGFFALLGVVALTLWWQMSVAGPNIQARVPGMDGLVAGPIEAIPVPEPGDPILGDGQPSAITDAWPWFRGTNGDAIGSSDVKLARSWPNDGPSILWTTELGPGYAGPAVAKGCVYLLDYDPDALADTMRCLSLEDGREIWRNSYPIEIVENHGMSRTVPAVVDDYVISMGPKCHVTCWDADTGEAYWLIDLVDEYEAKVPTWYTGQCPLIDDGRVILAPCGSAGLIAVDYTSGEVIWESPKLSNWEMTHVSIAAMEFGGRKMYVYCGSGGVAGISALDGSVLWQSTEWTGQMATCPTPIPLDDGRIFFCGGYKAGSLMMQLKQDNGQFTAESIYRLDAKVFESEQQTPVLFEEHLYGVRTRPGGLQMVCLDLAGNELWNSGSDKFGGGPYMIADGLLFAMSNVGQLYIAEATADGYRPLDQFTALEHAHDAWGPMALVSGRLILRDLSRMVCLDVAEK